MYKLINSYQQNSDLKQIIKYYSASIFGYCLAFIGTLFFHKIIGLTPQISYFITVTIVYIIQYIISIKYIFNSTFNSQTLTKYIAVLVVFWGLNNVLYTILLEILDIYYLIAILINIVFFSFVRFLVQKKFIFN